MREIKFLDVKAAYIELKGEIDRAISRVLSSGNYIGGVEVNYFEQEFADFCGAKYAVGVGNGLDALTICLRVLEVGPGDDVIVPSNTFIATWLAVSSVGANIIPVEPKLGRFNIDADDISQRITNKTKVVIPVHLYGIPAEIDEICELARAEGIHVVEDAAQAHGARYKGRRIGECSGDFVCWSFYPGKNLGALGDAGAITTDSAELVEIARSVSTYGSTEKYIHTRLGVNSRLDPIQASILRVKLRHLDNWNKRRSRIAQSYFSSLADTSFGLPFVPKFAEPVWHIFAILHARANILQSHLREHGVEVLAHYPIPPHKQNSYQSFDFSGFNLTRTEDAARQLLSLPIGPHQSADDTHYICDVLRTFDSKLIS